MSQPSYPIFEFIRRNYLHLDTGVPTEAAGRIATDPEIVARHPFYPFMRHTVITQKIRKKRGGIGVEVLPRKERFIAYAAHKDAHIFTHYSAIV